MKSCQMMTRTDADGSPTGMPCGLPTVGITQDGVRVCPSCATAMESEGFLVQMDRDVHPAKNAHAYMLLIIDTREPDQLNGKAIIDLGGRKLEVDIYPESAPVLPSWCYTMVLLDSSTPDGYDAAFKMLMDFLDVDGCPLAWVKPLLRKR